MSYDFQELHRLADWIRQQGGDPSGFVSERQAAFIAQQLAGTFFKFPSKGVSCFEILKKIEKEIELNPELRARSIDLPRPPKNGIKKGKVRKGGGVKDSRVEPAYIGVSVFTDGAAVPNPGAGGWGFVVDRDREEIHHACGGDRNTTNNATELVALLEGLEWIFANHPTDPATIYTDSTYARDCSSTWVDGWVKRGWRLRGDKPIANLEIIRAIYCTKLKLPEVSIQWVPGHAGERGNERADELSEQGRVKGGAMMKTGEGNR